MATFHGNYRRECHVCPRNELRRANNERDVLRNAERQDSDRPSSRMRQGAYRSESFLIRPAKAVVPSNRELRGGSECVDHPPALELSRRLPALLERSDRWD